MSGHSRKPKTIKTLLSSWHHLYMNMLLSFTFQMVSSVWILHFTSSLVSVRWRPPVIQTYKMMLGRNPRTAAALLVNSFVTYYSFYLPDSSSSIMFLLLIHLSFFVDLFPSLSHLQTFQCQEKSIIREASSAWLSNGQLLCFYPL